MDIQRIKMYKTPLKQLIFKVICSRMICFALGVHSLLTEYVYFLFLFFCILRCYGSGGGGLCTSFFMKVYDSSLLSS